MSDDRRSDDGGDAVRQEPGQRPFDISSTAWLVGEGVRSLNAAGKEAELSYGRAVEILRREAAAAETIVQLLRDHGSGDASLRWSLLHLLGDVADAESAPFLARTALEPLPARDQSEGCEDTRDTELLIRTMALQALGRVAERHPEAQEHLVDIVRQEPDRAIVIEAIQIGAAVGLREMGDALRQEDRWILDIQRRTVDDVQADPERDDGTERGFTPPRTGSDYDAPQVDASSRRGP